MIANYIAAHARNVHKKRNKALAFDALRAILEDLPEEMHDSHGPDLARLYAFFEPQAPAKPKTVFDWVAKAMAKKDQRHYLNWVYSDGARIIATNGHRLHIAHVALEPGFYDKNGTLAHGPEYAVFPDVDRVIPPANPAPVQLADLTPITTRGKVIHKVRINGAVSIDRAYMQDADSMGPGEWTAPENKSRPARIDYPHGTAVIMPIKD